MIVVVMAIVVWAAVTMCIAFTLLSFGLNMLLAGIFGLVIATVLFIGCAFGLLKLSGGPG